MFCRRPVLRSSRMITPSPAREQRVGEMRADEACASGDEMSYVCLLYQNVALPSPVAFTPSPP